MRAGSLDRRVELQHRVLGARTARGSQVETYETYATVWARKQDLTGREYFAAQGMNAEGSTKFVIRFREDVLETDRVLFNGRSYNVRNIAELGRREGLELTVSTVA
jgi:SPP1 family predicted phage head-tail adaptor